VTEPNKLIGLSAAPKVTPQLVPVFDENGIVIDLIADTAFLEACREREDRYNERD